MIGVIRGGVGVPTRAVLQHEVDLLGGARDRARGTVGGPVGDDLRDAALDAGTVVALVVLEGYDSASHREAPGNFGSVFPYQHAPRPGRFDADGGGAHPLRAASRRRLTGGGPAWYAARVAVESSGSV